MMLAALLTCSALTFASSGTALRSPVAARGVAVRMSCSPFGSDPSPPRVAQGDEVQAELVVPLTLPGQTMHTKRVVEQDKAFYHHLRVNMLPSALFTGLALTFVALKTGLLERLGSPIAEPIRKTREQSQTLRQMVQLQKELDLPYDSPEFRKALEDAAANVRSQGGQGA